MKNSPSHAFLIGPTDFGKWLAVSEQSPYFAFEGESAEAVEATANRALDFYFATAGQIKSVTRERSKTISSFAPTKRVERRAA